MSKLALYGIFIQTIFCSLLVASNGNAQEKLEEIQVKVSKQKSSLYAIFQDIEAQTEFEFSYNDAIVNLDETVQLKLKRPTLYQVLSEISKEAKLKFKRIDESIYVSNQESSNTKEVEEVISILINQVKISGTVTSAEDGEPLPGVSILVKGTSQGTTTDLDGKYMLEAPENATLQFSYIGFETLEVPVGNQSQLNIQLQPDMEQLEEVVVVGYGTTTKKDLTGSVSQVKAQDMENMKVINVNQALQGRAAGVVVSQNQTQPGGNVSVRIRGGSSINASNEPLYVIDGVISEYGLNSLNPNDIESVDILKDASSIAIYGARGSNGVVIITTKRGKEGKAKFSFNASFGTQEVTQRYSMMNTSQYVDAVNDNYRTNYDLGINPNDSIALVDLGNGNYYDIGLNDTIKAYETDWQNELIRNAPIRTYQLSFSGGTDKAKYYFSGEYFDQKGVIINTFFKRYSLRFNGEFKLNKIMTAGTNIMLSSNRSTQTGFDQDSPLDIAVKMPPILPVVKENGEYTRTGFDGLSVGPVEANPVAKMKEISDIGTSTRALLNTYLNFDIIEGLKFRTSLSADVSFWNRERYVPTFIEQGTLPPATADDPGVAQVWNNQNYNVLSENTLTYIKDLNDDNRINAVLGMTYQTGEGKGNNMRGAGFPSDDLGIYNLPLSSKLNSSDLGLYYNDFTLMSYLGRVNYTFKDKYLFTVSGRADGSSRFGANNKWAFFPSAALAYRLSDENFFQNIDVIDNLKLRVSYGMSGNQAVPIYFSIQRINPSGQYIFGGIAQSGLAYSNTKGNPDLTWEKTQMFNAGIDLGIINNRYRFSVDLYRNVTDDLLFLTQLRGDPLFANQWQNIGTVENKGVEFTFESDIIDGPKFKWNMNLNFAYNHNEVLKLDGEREHLYTGSSDGGAKLNDVGGTRATNILEVGRPIGALVGLRTDGIYQNQQQVEGDPTTSTSGSMTNGAFPGDIKYKDINGDNKITTDDFSVLGNALPNFTGGFNNSFSYGNLTLDAFFIWATGNSVVNVNNYFIDQPGGGGNKSTDVLNRWSGEGTSNTMPRAGYSPYAVLNDQQVEDASFLRLTNLTLAYNIPTENISWLGRLRVYATGQNLLTFTNYSGYNPEVNTKSRSGFSSSAGQLAFGVDLGSYPFYRTYLLGVNLEF